eukprot:3523694-Amphidinium_carterae.2
MIRESIAHVSLPGILQQRLQAAHISTRYNVGICSRHKRTVGRWQWQLYQLRRLVDSNMHATRRAPACCCRRDRWRRESRGRWWKPDEHLQVAMTTRAAVADASKEGFQP